MTRNNFAADLVYQKLRGVTFGDSLCTFRMHPNYQKQETRPFSWNFFSHDKLHPRPFRFLFSRAEDRNKAERNYLNGAKSEADMRLFIKLVTLENVPRYFQWTYGQLRLVEEGILDFDDLDDAQLLIF